jgi:hypothetical protein
VTARPFAVAALSALVAACAAPSLYQPMNLEGGYASTRLGADTFNVVFQGNAHTPRATAEAYALYRSAELTVATGFDYFVVVGGTSDAAALLRAARHPAPTAADSDTDHPLVSITIRAFGGEKPSPQAFNAREVLKELGPSIQRQ